MAGEISFQDPIYVCWLKTEYFAKKWRRSVEQGRRGTAGNASEFSAEIRYVVESAGIAGFRDAAAFVFEQEGCFLYPEFIEIADEGLAGMFPEKPAECASVHPGIFRHIGNGYPATVVA